MRSALLVATTWALIAAALAYSQKRTPQPDQGDALPADTALTLPVDLGAVHPRISRDGRQIVFSYQGTIWRTARTGGTALRLTEGPGFDMEPVFSPDSKRIAFSRSPGWSGGELHVIDAESGQEIDLPKRVSNRGTVAFYKMEFDPQANRLLGVWRSAGTDHGLSWFDLDTGEITELVDPDRWSRFALSRDGQRVAYIQTPNVPGQQGGNNGWHATIHQVSADGSQRSQLGVFPARVHDLCWGPDDRSLIVATDLGSPFYDLWNVPLNAGKLDMSRAEQLTFQQGDEHRPSVSDDGFLLHTANHKGPTRLLLSKLGTGSEQLVPVRTLDYAAETGTLKLQTLAGDSQQPITTRVSVKGPRGTFHAPPGSLYRVLRGYGHFYCEGSCRFELPVGEYQVRVFHGPEFRTTQASFTIQPGADAELILKVDRWTDQSADGWHSGENHIHANYGYGEWYNSPASMLTQCAGEDLAVCNFMVANSDGDGIFDRHYFRGQLDPRSTDETLLYWNQEFRSTIWGHMTLVNLSQLVEPIMTGFPQTTNPWDVPTNSDVAAETHLQDGIVNYTHVAQRPDDPYLNPYTGKSIPVDAALGHIDSLDLNASYAGTVPLWYRLLNCGFRLTGSAGTDTFLNRINSRLPGGDRVYVQLDGKLTYGGWIDGVRAGRTFVTNGPMLRLEVEGSGVGDTVKLPRPDRVTVAASLAAQFPLERFELVHNGQVIKSVTLEANARKAELNMEVDVPTNGWLAVRASGPGHPDHPLGTQYAHTSPVYLEVRDRPFDASQDAAYFLKWIDRLQLDVRVRNRIPSAGLRRHVEQQLDAARSVYRRLAQ